MNIQNLRELLQKADNRIDIFVDVEKLNQYELNTKELLDLISEFLSDEEKFKLFDYSYFQTIESRIKIGIIRSVSDKSIKSQMLKNDFIMGSLKSYHIVGIVKDLDSNEIKQMLYDKEFLEKYHLADYEFIEIISDLDEVAKFEMLSDKELIVNKLRLSYFQIGELTKDLTNDEAKIKLLKIHEFDNNLAVDVINTLNDTKKFQILMEDGSFNKYEKIKILNSMEINTLTDLLVNKKEFLTENNIHPYEVIRALDIDKQKGFVSKIQEIDLTLNDKKEILATLKEDVKKSVDTTNYSKELKTAISIQTKEYNGQVILDLERNIEDYKGLDNLMKINPENFTEEQKNKFLELCGVCPDLKVVSILNNSVEQYSTASEYKEAEKWIESVINGIDPKYTKAQKMAVIDNAIGKKISYSADFNTESFDNDKCRALWKIIDSGYGICNGIAKVEQYILNKVGIESDIVGSDNHSFLKIKNIELPVSNDENVIGNTILDPTWNLTRHRFGGKPSSFCISYGEARKNDIDANGKDHNCHKNDEQLQDATLNLDEQSLRQLFTSVGLADKDGQFPIKDLIEKSKEIDDTYSNEPNKNINEQLFLLERICPEFATCQNSSMSILKDVLLSNKNMKFNKCVVNRVYDKTDEEKKSVLYVYIDSDELGEKFYFADKSKGIFSELTHEQFIGKFECYERDLMEHNRM